MINITLTVFLFGMPGTTELMLIAAVVLFLFGGKKIPELMRGIGKGIHEFKKGKSGIESEINKLKE
ncbi:MAG: twin-arginine translocase TatA/TatE family subunit [Bacteroidia bacterium]|nr:twin-arginine translocase TatA/TatE family subunit [Bacteroidia bacterium]